MRYISNSVEDTLTFAADFAKKLKAGDVIAFKGGMGAGKTAFMRGLAAGLDLQGEVCSPTFAIVHQYLGAVPVYHFDMYRVTKPGDIESTGFFDFLDTPCIITVEWSENITNALPANTTFVEIKILGETTREITIYGNALFE